MRPTALLALALAVLLAPHAFAQEHNYTYLELDYLDNRASDPGNAFGLQGSFAFTPHFHAHAEYTDERHATIGLGLNRPITPFIDILARAAYIDVNAAAPTDARDAHGLTLHAGLRTLIAHRLQLDGIVHHANLRDANDATTLRMSARLCLNPVLALNAGAELGSGTTIWLAGVRYNFVR